MTMGYIARSIVEKIGRTDIDTDRAVANADFTGLYGGMMAAGLDAWYAAYCAERDGLPHNRAILEQCGVSIRAHRAADAANL
jgi:hypothetical protein